MGTRVERHRLESKPTMQLDVTGARIVIGIVLLIAALSPVWWGISSMPFLVRQSGSLRQSWADKQEPAGSMQAFHQDPMHSMQSADNDELYAFEHFSEHYQERQEDTLHTGEHYSEHTFEQQEQTF